VEPKDNIQIRPIACADWRKLRRFHNRLSPATVQQRFHGAKRELSEALAHSFTNMDGVNNVALVATRGRDGRIIAVARYARIDAETAEVAFVVEDEYQGHGIGTRLMAELETVALQNGIRRFEAEVMPDNLRMFKLLAAAGPNRVRFSAGECDVTVELARSGSPALAAGPATIR